MQSASQVNYSSTSDVMIESCILNKRLQSSEIMSHYFCSPTRFRERLGQVIARSQLQKDYLFAVLSIEVERFRVMQYSLESPIGEKFLHALIFRLTENLRFSDQVTQLEGGEFVILLDHIKQLDEANQMAEQLRARLRSPFNIDGHEICLNINIGISTNHISNHHPLDILEDAYLAMYDAKMHGDMGYKVFDSQVRPQIVKRLQLEAELRRGIEHNEFQLYYQPIVLLKTGEITGFEALIRWQHPDRGLLLPTEFIPVAEETGLIVPLTWWILREACQQIQKWQQQFPTILPLTISINLSSQQFLQPNFLEHIDQILHETGLPGHYLNIEITESMPLENLMNTRQLLEELNRREIQLCIDDFGIGYSCFSYLQNFSINTLKIDRSFVSKIGHNPKSLQTIEAIISLAKNLGINVVAEGIETEDQLAHVEALHCEYGQGYFFSKPLDRLHVEALMASFSQKGTWISLNDCMNYQLDDIDEQKKLNKDRQDLVSD